MSVESQVRWPVVHKLIEILSKRNVQMSAKGDEKTCEYGVNLQDETTDEEIGQVSGHFYLDANKRVVFYIDTIYVTDPYRGNKYGNLLLLTLLATTSANIFATEALTPVSEHIFTKYNFEHIGENKPKRKSSYNSANKLGKNYEYNFITVGFLNPCNSEVEHFNVTHTYTPSANSNAVEICYKLREHFFSELNCI